MLIALPQYTSKYLLPAIIEVGISGLTSKRIPMYRQGLVILDPIEVDDKTLLRGSNLYKLFLKECLYSLDILMDYSTKYNQQDSNAFIEYCLLIARLSNRNIIAYIKSNVLTIREKINEFTYRGTNVIVQKVTARLKELLAYLEVLLLVIALAGQEEKVSTEKSNRLDQSSENIREVNGLPKPSILFVDT